MSRASKRRQPVGRPPKFAEPRRPITLTLPERTLAQLAGIDPDRARAIVKLADASAGDADGRTPHVQLVEIAPGTAVIVVGPSQALRRIPILELIEVAPSRYLLSMPPGTPVESIEIAIVDALEGVAATDPSERALLNELRQQLRWLRQDHRMTKAEIIFVSTPHTRQRRTAG